MPEINDLENDPEFEEALRQASEEDVVEHIAEQRKIEHPEERVGYCGECKSVQPDQYMERNAFYQQGNSVPCKFCGGFTTIVPQELVGEELANMMDRRRGIGSTKQVG